MTTTPDIPEFEDAPPESWPDGAAGDGAVVGTVPTPEQLAWLLAALDQYDIREQHQCACGCGRVVGAQVVRWFQSLFQILGATWPGYEAGVFVEISDETNRGLANYPRRASKKFHSEACRQRAHRRTAKPEGVLTSQKELEPGDPGTPEWCEAHGFSVADLEQHGVWRFSSSEDETIADLYRPFTAERVAGETAAHLPTVRAVVRQSGGLVMPKSPLPGFGPIPVQLRPDMAVVTDTRVKRHRHDRFLPEGRKVLALVQRPGEPEKLIPRQWLRADDHKYIRGYEYSLEIAAGHVDKVGDEPYDAGSYAGDHHGENVNGWHKHAPRVAKYTNFGPNKRVDLGPNGLTPWRTASAGRAGLEGKLKHVAAEANDWDAANNRLSVTMWDEAEERWFARWLRDNNPDHVLHLGPDADWKDFARNKGAVFRQALYLQGIYQEEGIRVCITAPPAPAGAPQCKCKPVGTLNGGDTCINCGGYLKGEDDFYGAGGTRDQLVVLDRTPPRAAIAAFVQSLPIHGNRKPRAATALHRLSLHDRDGQELDFLDVPLKTLQRIMGASRPQVVPDILEDLAQAIAIEGPLDMKRRDYLRNDLTVGVAYDWVERPRIKVREPFRTYERTMKLREFEEETSDVTTGQAEIIDRLDALESRLDTWGWGIVDLIIKDRSVEDADYAFDEEAA